MALEIERKFLVVSNGWQPFVTRQRRLRQAYLTKNGQLSIRIRIYGAASATLTIKTAEPGIVRNEYEYPIPVADAEALIGRCEGVAISKVRHLVPMGDLTWEIDVFDGANAGLVIAEVELDRADRAVPRPDWLGGEVTGDRRYYNADLARLPFSHWPLTPPPESRTDGTRLAV